MALKIDQLVLVTQSVRSSVELAFVGISNLNTIFVARIYSEFNENKNHLQDKWK